MCATELLNMLTLNLLILFSLFFYSFSQTTIETVDLLQNGTFTWNGHNSGSTILNITAQNYSISATIETCDIGKHDARPNAQYLILKNGCENPISLDNGRIFAYIKKPKKLYFFSSSVILQLETPNAISKKCIVTFEKGDPEDSTLPPVTTTEAVTTYGPSVSKYSTVLISGKTIEQFNENPSLVLQLKEDIASMANDYTEVEGFCLTKKIESDNIEIYTLEQCPTQWPDFTNCVRLVYAIPVKYDSSCSLWEGYQLTSEHLDLMWSKLALKYLNGFSIYEQPAINNLVTWWVICMVLLTLLFSIIVIAINLVWRRRESIKRAQAFDDIGYISDMRNSEESLTPSYFQPIPPMFGKTDNLEENNGQDNRGFQYNILDND